MFAKFFLSAGRLRPLWRAVLFFLLLMFALPWLLNPLAGWLWNGLHIEDSLNPAATAFGEGVLFVTALIATAVFAIAERRRIDSYGLPLGRALGRQTWDGAIAGVAMPAFVAAGMLLFGGMQIRGFAAGGTVLGASALAWLGANIMVGIAEEFAFRGYLLQTLWRSIGFWPACLVTTAYFVALHYFFKPGENVWDVISLVGLSLLLCYTLLRTGTLWFAVGFHVAFDFMQFFVIGTPNGEQVPVGRLLDIGFDGPAWLTGGVLGTEASVLMYPAIVLLWLYVAWRYRNRPVWQPGAETLPTAA